MTTCNDKYKQTLSAYYIKGNEKTLSMSENKENKRDGHVASINVENNYCTQRINTSSQHRRRT